MEGVMMRNGEKYAVAVRTADKKIAVQQDVYYGLTKIRKYRRSLLSGACLILSIPSAGHEKPDDVRGYFAEETPEELEERLAGERKKAEKRAERLKRQGKEDEALSFWSRRRKRPGRSGRKEPDRQERGRRRRKKTTAC